MSDQITLSVDKRAGKGKGFSRRLRQQEMFPGIYYNAEGANTMVQVQALPFKKVYDKVHTNRVIYLEIKDGQNSETSPVLIWDVRFHPVKRQVEHVDFLGVDLNKAVTVDVPVAVTGKAKGLTKDGVVSIFRDTITVHCLPTLIPEQVVLDITDLDLNESIQIQDIVLPEGVKAVFDENFSVVGVTPIQVAAAEEKVEAQAEGASAGEESKA